MVSQLGKFIGQKSHSFTILPKNIKGICKSNADLDWQWLVHSGESVLEGYSICCQIEPSKAKIRKEVRFREGRYGGLSERQKEHFQADTQYSL